MNLLASCIICKEQKIIGKNQRCRLCDDFCYSRDPCKTITLREWLDKVATREYIDEVKAEMK